MALAAGTQLGRYTVVKPLVTGGMADVLLARATGMVGFQHHVVIKCIRAHKQTDPQFIKMFLEEARLAASLHHHHIVQVHDVGRENNDYFFAMEYVHGENLRALLTRVARAREVVPLEQIITIIIAVASALHYAHQQNIVHRDVTPANIIIGYDGNVKVCDFGIAKAVLQSSELTKSATMRGKVAYMAPEQCLGRPIDRRADIFSLGIVLYELCTSRRLFKGDTDFLVMTSIVNGKVPKPTLHRKDLPLDLEDVILKALAPKPELRFATAEDLAMALERVATNNGLRISSTALADYMSKLFGRRTEPWLSDETTGIEMLDVDFDGAGTGLVGLSDDEPSNPTIERELLESPFFAATRSGVTDAEDDEEDENEFAEEPRTELVDPEEAPTNLADGKDVDAAIEAARLLRAGGTPSAKPRNPFEAGERTQIGEQADLDVLRGMSKIEGRRDATPLPLPAPAQPPPYMPTPVPIQHAAPVLRTPVPMPINPSAELPSTWASPDGAVTGTPMAWAPQDGEVPSLAPKGRRFMLIAAVAVPIVVIGVLVIMMGNETTPAKAVVEPDAFVEPPAPDAAQAAAIDAALIDAPAGSAATPVTKPPAKPPVKAPINRPVAPVKKPPIKR